MKTLTNYIIESLLDHEDNLINNDMKFMEVILSNAFESDDETAIDKISDALKDNYNYTKINKPLSDDDIYEIIEDEYVICYVKHRGIYDELRFIMFNVFGGMTIQLSIVVNYNSKYQHKYVGGGIIYDNTKDNMPYVIKYVMNIINSDVDMNNVEIYMIDKSAKDEIIDAIKNVNKKYDIVIPELTSKKILHFLK